MGYYSVSMYGLEFENYLIDRGVSQENARGYIDIIYMFDLFSSDRYSNNIEIFNDGSERYNHFFIGVPMSDDVKGDYDTFKSQIHNMISDVKKDIILMMSSTDPDLIDDLTDNAEELNEYIPTKTMKDYLDILDGFVLWAKASQPDFLSGVSHG